MLVKGVPAGTVHAGNRLDTLLLQFLRLLMYSNMMTSSNGNISALLAICAGNSPVTGEFLAQRPVTRSFGVFFDLRLNKRLSKQSRDWWFETRSLPLWRHCNGAIFRWSHITQNYKFDLVYYASYHVPQCKISYWIDPFLSKRAFLDISVRCDISACNVINVQTVIPVNIKSTEEFYENGKYSIFGMRT